MSRINILHLSDIHFKRKKVETNKTFRRDVKVKMIESIKTHLEKNHLEPDFVIVTGDMGKGTDQNLLYGDWGRCCRI